MNFWALGIFFRGELLVFGPSISKHLHNGITLEEMPFVLMIFNPPMLSYLECVEENHLVISLALMIHALAPKSEKNLGMLPPPAQQWLSWRFVFWVEISEKIYRHPGDGIYTPSKWWHYVTCHESTGQGLHIHPWIFQAFMLHCLSQLGGPITTEIHWAMNPLRPSKTIAFCEVLMGVCPLPPQKKERLPHLTASWQLPWHTNSYKHVFSRRQVTSSRRQGAHHVTVESDQKGPRKNEWILKQLHGNRDISRNPVTPFKGPWQTRTIKQSGFASFSPCFCRRATSAFRRITSRKSLQNNVWILLWATANLFLPLFHGDI